jgi:regulator of sigma E protease
LITQINDDSLTSWDALAQHVITGPEVLRLRVAGRSEPIVLHLAADTAVRRNVLRSLAPMIPPRIGPVNLGQPAHRAGLKAGDIVLKVDQDTVIAWSDMVRRIRQSPGKPLVLTVQRKDKVLQVPVTPDVVDSGGLRYGIMGAFANPPMVREAVPLGRALAIGVRQTGLQVATVVVSVKRLVTGKASAKELGGPIAIAQMSGQAARLGLDWFLNFLAFFSVSLAVLNLLPIPVLDGGHAMFLIAEGILRKPVSPQLRLRLTQLGMLIVLAIMILAISNDVIRNIR